MTKYTCPICLDKFALADIRLLACGHSACADCLSQWLRSQHTCPSCRAGASPSLVLIPRLTEAERTLSLVPPPVPHNSPATPGRAQRAVEADVLALRMQNLLLHLEKEHWAAQRGAQHARVRALQADLAQARANLAAAADAILPAVRRHPAVDARPRAHATAHVVPLLVRPVPAAPRTAPDTSPLLPSLSPACRGVLGWAALAMVPCVAVLLLDVMATCFWERVVWLFLSFGAVGVFVAFS